MGDTVAKGTPVTLRFKYSGILNTPPGGPLLTKRLAYIGESRGYLMYAARWFPFHDYAADAATSDISISFPSGYQLVGYSDTPVARRAASIASFSRSRRLSEILLTASIRARRFVRRLRDAVQHPPGQ